jgi:hypothetical protein
MTLEPMTSNVRGGVWYCSLCHSYIILPEHQRDLDGWTRKEIAEAHECGRPAPAKPEEEGR